MNLLTGPAYAEVFHTYRSAFRAELSRDGYRASDLPQFERWLSGDAAPDPVYTAAVMQDLRAELADGRDAYRVKCMGRGDYDLYAAEWGYPYTVEAGERVFILDLTERTVPVEADGLPDFWVIDGRVLIVHYDDTRQFLGASWAAEEDAPRFLAARDALMACAVPFPKWRETHRNLPRAACPR